MCLLSKYGSCELFSECTLETRLLNKVSLFHQHQEYSKDYEIQESLEIGDLVSNDQIVAIAAENSSIDTLWFVYVIDIKCVDHLLSNNIGDCGHNVPKSQPYLFCSYLEKLNDDKKSVAYIYIYIYIKIVKKNVFIYKESIVYSLIEFDSNYNKKEDLLFLINNKKK